MFSKLSDFSLFPKNFCDSQALCKLHPSTSKANQTAVNFPLNLHLGIYYSFMAVSCTFQVRKDQYIFCKSFCSKNVLKETTRYQQVKHIILTLPVSWSSHSLESKDFNLTVLFLRNHCYLSSAITTNCFAHEATIFSWVKQPLDGEKNHTANSKVMYTHCTQYKIQWMTQFSQSEYKMNTKPMT